MGCVREGVHMPSRVMKQKTDGDVSAFYESYQTRQVRASQGSVPDEQDGACCPVKGVIIGDNSGRGS